MDSLNRSGCDPTVAHDTLPAKRLGQTQPFEAKSLVNSVFSSGEVGANVSSIQLQIEK
jgi:hypothetical protein